MLFRSQAKEEERQEAEELAQAAAHTGQPGQSGSRAGQPVQQNTPTRQTGNPHIPGDPAQTQLPIGGYGPASTNKSGQSGQDSPGRAGQPSASADQTEQPKQKRKRNRRQAHLAKTPTGAPFPGIETDQASTKEARPRPASSHTSWGGGGGRERGERGE